MTSALVSGWIREIRSDMDWKIRQYYDAPWLADWLAEQTSRIAALAAAQGEK